MTNNDSKETSHRTGIDNKDPYINFVGAIIKKAVEDKSSGKVEAHSWLKSDSKEPKAFEWYCGLVGLNPDVVRELAGVK